MNRLLLAAAILITSLTLYAQEEKQPGGEVFKPFHQLGLTIGHEHAFSGRDENNKKEIAILPFWGLDYNFQLASKFAIGLHTDFIVENFKVEKNTGDEEKEVIERTKPIAPALMGFYKPAERWSFGFGVGGEFAKEENYFLNRLAV